MVNQKVSNYEGGNLYNKYESKNPILKLLMNKFFKDLNFILDSININTVLDVGCGEGYVTNHIKQYKNDIYVEGIDFYDEVIETAKSLHPEIKFSKGSIYKLPYNAKTFDLLVVSEVLEHLEQPEKAIDEIKRVSKKYFIITVPNEPLFRIANILRLKYLSTFGNTPGHIQHWTKKDFGKLLDGHFRNVSLKTSTLWQIALCEI
jgi:ubiquinone/menaquinone biosynthesis C-methylase UbiE